MDRQYTPTSDFDPNSKLTHPSEKLYVPENILIIDSRQRDLVKYPNPSEYTIDIGNMYKYITEIELKGSVIPKTMYNIHNTNKYIDFNIGSSVTSIQLKTFGYRYTVPPTVTISPPYGATATAILSSGILTQINVTSGGSGYTASNPPQIYITPPPGSYTSPIAEATIGTAYLAILRPGQYSIGGNPTTLSANAGSGLIKEIQDSMNYAVSGTYVSGSSSPFQVRLVSQYPAIDAVAGTPDAYASNACLFNRIQITNVLGDPWELMFGTGQHAKISMSTVMGFPSQNLSNPVSTLAVAGITDAGTSLRASFDYNLQDDPNYVVLNLTSGNSDATDRFERQASANHSLNRTFASLVFDANQPNILTDTIGTTDGSGYLVGPVTKGPFWYPNGLMKPLRGYDYDQKILQISAAIGRIERLSIKFTQYSPDGQPTELYDFGGQNHQLIFSVKATDTQTGKRWST
jgi:hypothetical protein